jgi:RecB family exonuclease
MPRKLITQKKEDSPLKKALKVIDSLPTKKESKKDPRKFVYERLSASMLKTFLQCKRKFYTNYIEGKKSDPSQSLSLGTAFHEAQEQANIYLKEHKRILNPMEIEYYVQIFRNVLASSHVDDQEAFEIGEEMMRRELSPEHMRENIVGIEDQFDLVTPEGVRIYGFIDKLVESDEDSNTIRVIDYKTSVMPLSYEEAKLDEQLSMYDLAISLKYPQYENRILELRYVRTGDSISLTKTAIEQQNFRRRLLAVDKAIRKFIEDTAEGPDGDLNQFCSWCSYKSSCPTYIDHMNTLLPGFPNIDALDDKSFIDMWERVSAIYKAAEAWKDSLKLWALQRIEAFPEAPIDDGNKQIYTMSTARREYDPVTVSKIIGIKDLLGASTGGQPLIKVSNSALEGYMKKNKDKKIQAKLEQAVKVKFNSPQVRVKKSK